MMSFDFQLVWGMNKNENGYDCVFTNISLKCLTVIVWK